jgi:peptide/nickel transport system ATP-binding protein
MSTVPATEPARTVRSQTPFLVVDDLRVHFPTDDGLVKSVDGVSFELEAGRTLGIVGESGSGKSVTSQAIMGLHRRSNALVTGQILLDDEDLVTVTDARIRELRGQKMAMIFQDPMSSLHPYYSIGNQIMEGFLVHNDVSKSVARKAALDVLDRVGIPNAKVRIDQYPHEFSGGMRQRAMIAMALVNNPKLLIADEPTTALDVTVQAQILGLMKDLQKEYGSAIIIITHDLGVVADMADDLLVMYGGKPVETGSTSDVFYRSEDPYTWGLLSSMPRMDHVRQERLVPITGTPPSLINLPTGCAFHPRCAFTDRVPGDTCRTVEPELLEAAPGHAVRCHIDSPQRKKIFETEIKPRLAGS